MLQWSDAQESQVSTFICEIQQYTTTQELDETVLKRYILWELGVNMLWRYLFCYNSISIKSEEDNDARSYKTHV